jgi:charged multivesicular body protein 5
VNADHSPKLVEQLQDEMADLMDIGNDIQESISRSYDIPEGWHLPLTFLLIVATLTELPDVDEAELDAELEALGEEVELGGGWEADAIGAGEVPGFLQNEPGVPEFIDEPPTGEKVKQAI